MSCVITGILVSPLIASLIITFFTQRFKKLSAFISIGSLLTSLGLSLYVFSHFAGLEPSRSWEISTPWLQVDGLTLEWGYLINHLTLLMLLVVTGIGSAIFIFSWGYMSGDKSWSRYFAALSFFAFSMLGIVLSNNFLQIFIFWELVGLSSYLLISFWFEKEPAALAGKKAFIVNKIGDIFFLFGIILVWYFSSPIMGERTLNFVQLATRISAIGLKPEVLTMLSLLIFAGVVGKSAQFPLHVWLPDAMEGPTPVSALIHAATMVAAGVYLLARTFFLFHLSSDALFFVGATGLFTAFFASLIAVTQDDIKRILAYSTLSQLGYMVMAVGLSGPSEGMFHLVTHACFKALLFLAAGSVIHAVHTQNIWEMGGLKKHMPLTTLTFFIGTLALAGIFPLSGYFSKDSILALAFESNKLFFIGGLATVFFTAFYMTRLFFVAFLGSPSSRSSKANESPAVMGIPLMVLAVLSVVAGFFPIEKFLTGHGPHAVNLMVPILSSLTALLGFGAGFLLFSKKSLSADPLIQSLGPIREVILKKFYMDEFYDAIVLAFQGAWCKVLSFFERFVVLGMEIDIPQQIIQALSRSVRQIQSGSLALYALLFTVGLIVIGFSGLWGVK